MSLKKNILAVYASRDKDVLQNLLFHLQPLEKDFNLAISSHAAIDHDQRWKSLEVSQSERTDIFLLLLGKTFLNSGFLEQDEFKRVIDLYKEDKAILIPIILDDCKWDVELAFDDYNFNFGELQVFRKDEKSMGDWESMDKVFTQVSYYLRGLFASSTKKNALGKSINKGDEEMQNRKKEGQIAMDFLEEGAVIDTTERVIKHINENEPTIRFEENNKLIEEAEVKEVIRKEKRQWQKAEIQKRIEKEVEAKRVVQEELPSKEVGKVQLEAGGKKIAEPENAEIGYKRDKTPREIVTVQERATKKNRLSRYNYQFKIAKVVEAKRADQEDRRGKKEWKGKGAVREKRSGEITKSLRRPVRVKRPEEIVALQEKATKKNRLSRYNYQFEIAKVVEDKRAVLEESRVNDEQEAKMAAEKKTQLEIAKSQRKREWKKRLGEIIIPLKRIMQNSLVTIKNYQVKTAKATRQFFKEGEIIIPLKKRMQNSLGTIQNYQVKTAKSTHQFFKEGEIIIALKRVMQNSLQTLHNHQVKTFEATHQFFKEAKKNINTNKKRIVRPEFLILTLVICGILIYLFTGDSGTQSTTLSEIEKEEVVSDAGINTQTNQENQAAAILKLGIGDMHRGGIIFSVDPMSKSGKIAYIDDRGPMTWNKAMNIHEQLGEGWRLPNMDELRLMYENIGQGADNKGEFSDELYWSTTPYDDYQARLLRFSDGNASYHYNSVGTHRKFLVRAIQDFKQ